MYTLRPTYIPQMKGINNEKHRLKKLRKRCHMPCQKQKTKQHLSVRTNQASGDTVRTIFDRRLCQAQQIKWSKAENYCNKACDRPESVSLFCFFRCLSHTKGRIDPERNNVPTKPQHDTSKHYGAACQTTQHQQKNKPINKNEEAENRK